MRPLPLPAIAVVAALLTACGSSDPDAGCREGRLAPCTCADGSEGTRACGEAACTCEGGPACLPGETVSCTCDDGREGAKACGADACVCEEPECRAGEIVACTCDDGRAGQKACGDAECACAPVVCVLRHAAGIDFGAVPPGFTAERELVLANEGDGPCTIADLRLDGCDPAFGLAVPFAPGVVEPGEELAIPVSFHAAGGQVPPCALVLEVPEGDPAGRTVWLSGTVDPDCLSVGPLSLDLGEVEPGCATGQADVTIDNRCGIPVRLDRLELEGDEDFLLLSAPPVPMDVAAGTQLPITIGFRPPAVGAHAGELHVGLAGFGPLAIPVVGVATERAWTTDTFQTPARPKVDLLFVIDNGTGMADDLESVRSNLSPVLSFAAAQDIDFHFGVTTTGLVPGGDCPGGVGGGEDGRLFPVVGSTDRVVTLDTPAMEAAWLANVQVGACRGGPNQVFEAAVRALTPPVENAADDPRHPEASDGNAGFLRPEAHLSVIAITDRDDESAQSANFYYNALQSLKGFRNTHLFNFHAVAGDPETGCQGADGRTASPADRLASLVNKTDGGVFESFCRSDWEVAFREMSSAVHNWPQRFYLSSPPLDLNGNGVISDVDGELEVRMNGTLVPSRGPQGQAVWYYSVDEMALAFAPLATPGPETTIEVRYHAACP